MLDPQNDSFTFFILVQNLYGQLLEILSYLWWDAAAMYNIIYT